MSEFASAPHDERRGAVRYAHAVRAHWLLVTSIVVGALAVAMFFLSTTPKQYVASADIVLSPVSANDDAFQGFSLFRQSLDGSSAVITAARVFESPEISRPAMRLVSRSMSNVAIAIEPVSQADIVSVTSTAESAADAAKSANVYADTAVAVRTATFQRELLDTIGRLERRMAAVPASQRQANFEYAALAQRVGQLKGFIGTNDPTLRVASRATPPSGPSWPRPKLTVAAALLASLLLGVGLAVLLEVVNPRIGREDELQLSQRLPVLARIPRLSARTAHGYLTGQKQLPGTAWKGYRTLRAVLATAGPDGAFPRSILVTSATPGDGKTMTAVNLAITLAASDMRVILVDADLHRPMVGTIFNVAAKTDGFTAVLANRAPAERMLVPAPAHPRLRLLLARREHMAQVRLFDQTRLGSMLERLLETADVVIVDSPPLPEVAEALELAATVDTVVLAVRLGHTRRDKLNQLREMLARRGVSPMGFVVTTRSGSESESPYDYTGELAAAPTAEVGTEAPARARPRREKEREPSFIRLRD